MFFLLLGCVTTYALFLFLFMDNSLQIKKRGGRRVGAGRPSTESKLYTFRAPKAMAEYIDMQDNKTEFIKECIVHHMANNIDAATFSLPWGTAYSMAHVRGGCLPFFDISVVAGFPIPLDNDERSQDIDLLRMLCPYPESCYLIRVEGNSMIDAGIFSGDIVIVDKSNRTPNESQVAVCEFNGEYTLKRFVKRNGEGWMVPANPDYPEIKVTEHDSFSIWGVVTYVIHKPRN
jgi:DNA polymerase V